MSADTLIQVENLQKYYKGGEIKALDGVNADIRKGKVVVVIGPSGSIMSARTMATRCFCPPDSCAG